MTDSLVIIGIGGRIDLRESRNTPPPRRVDALSQLTRRRGADVAKSLAEIARPSRRNVCER